MCVCVYVHVCVLMYVCMYKGEYLAVVDFRLDDQVYVYACMHVSMYTWVDIWR
jgi:hypothetical protein